MKCYGVGMVQSTLGLLSFLVCIVDTRGSRYGDYSVGHMPQYEDRHEVGHADDLMLAMEDYNDKSPDAPARLDYKYEEEQHKRNNVAIKDMDEEGLWDKPRRKIKKPHTSHNNRYVSLNKKRFDDIALKNHESDRFFDRRSSFQNNDFESESTKRMKHKLIDPNEDLDKEDDKNQYVRKDDLDNVEVDEFEDVSRLRHRFATQRKVRRKPRDRAFRQPEKTRDDKHIKLEEEEFDTRVDRDQYFGRISSQSPVRITNHLEIRRPNTQAHDFDYDEFYDMKRVHNLKDRLPALLQQKTVKTTGSQSIRYLENRKRFERRDASMTEATTEKVSATTISTLKSSTARPSTLKISSTTITAEPKPGEVNTSSLSLAEKSRLSILKKAMKKESGRNVSRSTKPPVLMQITQKMQTMVVVEQQALGDARARLVDEESPSRLQRARRLMRHKLVAAARNIHDLTDNWDDMVCDYIDVSLLDSDSATCIQLDILHTLLFYSFVLIVF